MTKLCMPNTVPSPVDRVACSSTNPFPGPSNAGWKKLTVLVDRTVSRWQDNRWVLEGEKLSDFRSARAYVLLGEAGTGKSTAFEEEKRNDRNAVEVTARRFIRRRLEVHPEWRDATLLIDGFDEVRAGGGDLREPLDSLMCRLEKLGNPRFRLSCREDSWLGRNDLRELSSVAGGEIHLLRLDPLSEQDAHRILAAAGVSDPDRFYWNAKDRGLEAFLQNPLLLDILVKANDSDTWPEGRLATFERACETLAKETNQEHLDAWDGHPFAVEEVVLAAGRLCSILLLCGNSGWSRRGPGDDEYPPLSEAGEGQPLLKFALDTKLFEGDAETGRRPRHRQIAEFLAAGYLDHAIRDRGLPATRVLAWMRGMDGIVMPDLRGVSVWLAGKNPEFRRPVIESDPVGVAFHGDAERFSREDIVLLFSGLEAQLKHQLLTQQWESASSASLGALVAGPGREILYDMLRAPDRSDVRHHLVERLLRGLGEATLRSARSGVLGSEDARRGVHTVLAATVRDPSWRSSVRNRALIELIWVLEDLAEGPSILLGLLRDLAEGEVLEDEGGTLGLRLLDHLYPQHIGAERIWDYVDQLWTAAPPTKKSWDGDKRGWARRLVNRSAPGDVRILLETLVRNSQRLNKVLVQNDAEYFAERLLTRSLQLFGEETEPAHLYEWFELVQAANDRPGLVLAHCEGVTRKLQEAPCKVFDWIYDWLRSHRDIQLALVLEGLKRNASHPRDRALDPTIGVKFLGDKAPTGFRRWCLEKAVALAKTDRASAIELAFWSVTEREDWGPPLNEEEVLAAVQGTPLLLEWHEQRAAEASRHRESPQSLQGRERREAYVSSIREQLSAVEAGQEPPEILHELGRVYLDGFEAGGINRARTSLGLHLGGDNDLREAAFRGFRNLVERTDLPALDETAVLHAGSGSPPFGAAFRAGLMEKEGTRVEQFAPRDEEALGRALALYLLSGLHTRPHPIPVSFTHPEVVHLRHPTQPRPKWYLHALENHPQTVADAFVAVTRARVRRKEAPDQHLYDLPWEPEYLGVGPLAVPKMLAPFPIRCTKAQVVSLRLLLWAALKYMPPEDLRELVMQRLGRKGMDHAQRGTWLGAGLFVDREACLPRVVEFVSDGTEARCRYLLEFLVPYLDPLPNQQWPTVDLSTLIKAMGTKLSSPSDAGGFVLDWKLRPLLDVWVGTLAERVDQEGVAALVGLAEDPALENWRGVLCGARDQQATRCRISVYKAPTIPEFREGLRGGPPIGPADLAALVSDKLADLAHRIRNGNTDAWQQYWHTDASDPKGRKITEPKAEEPCRDALLSDLQILLEPHEVDAQPEGHHAEDARSDIIAVHGVHAVVVEVKKTDSRDLWSAITDQLIARYVRDPRSGGYGIFLVLWFGGDHLKRSSPAEARPQSPEELGRMLEGFLTHEQRRTITVIVVDVSAPAGRVDPANTGGP